MENESPFPRWKDGKLEVAPHTEWRASGAPGGWVRLRNDKGTVIYLQLRRDADGWPRVYTAVMRSQDQIRASSWNTVPFELAESLPLIASPIAEELAKTPSTVTHEGDFDSLFAEDALEAVLVRPLFGSPDPESLVSLQRPTGLLTDDFLEQLSAAYLELAMKDRAPAPAIARQTGAPVRTVHRWIAEARKRGHLPPARRGRAG